MGDVTRKLILQKSGSSEMSIDEVLLQYKRLVYKACKTWYSKYEMDDVKQIGFLGLVKAYNTYDANKGYMFMTYASLVVKNELLAFNKSNKTDKIVLLSLNEEVSINNDDTAEKLDLLADEVTCIEELGIDNIDLVKLGELIPTLPEKERVALTLFYMHDVPQKDIAVHLNCSQSYIGKLLRQGKKRLRQRLE